MSFFLQYVIRRTFQNMVGNLFPNFITISIIVISMLIFSTFTLIAFNLTNLLKIWEDKIEIIAYLKQGTSSREVEPLLNKTRLLEGVEVVRYVSPYDAMDFMATKLGKQKSLLEGIQPTVLPPSFEIQLKKNVLIITTDPVIVFEEMFIALLPNSPNFHISFRCLCSVFLLHGRFSQLDKGRVIGATGSPIARDHNQ
jgi:cell division protein FtsX